MSTSKPWLSLAIIALFWLTSCGGNSNTSVDLPTLAPIAGIDSPQNSLDTTPIATATDLPTVEPSATPFPFGIPPTFTPSGGTPMPATATPKIFDLATGWVVHTSDEFKLTIQHPTDWAVTQLGQLSLYVSTVPYTLDTQNPLAEGAALKLSSTDAQFLLSLGGTAEDVATFFAQDPVALIEEIIANSNYFIEDTIEYISPPQATTFQGHNAAFAHYHANPIAGNVERVRATADGNANLSIEFGGISVSSNFSTSADGTITDNTTVEASLSDIRESHYLMVIALENRFVFLDMVSAIADEAQYLPLSQEVMNTLVFH